MKWVLVGFMFMSIVNINAQKIFENFKQAEYINVNIKYELVMMKPIVTLSIDDGEDRIKKGTGIRGESGRMYNFKSIANAINFAASLGYELKTSYSLFKPSNNIYLIFKKKQK